MMIMNLNIPATFTLAFIFCFSFLGSAQKILRFEKSGSLKTRSFYIGDEISFKTFDRPDLWYTRTIMDLDPEKNVIYILNQGDDLTTAVYLSDISHFRIGQRNKLLQIIGQALMIGGINTVLTSFALSRRELIPSLKNNPEPIYYGILGSGVGFAIWRMFGRDGIKLNKRKRLRILDITLFTPA